MSRPDNIALANKKNRFGKSRLQTELNRINREQLIDIRMHNNAKQRFKSKYAKLDVFDDNKGSEASDVVMYETHNPGFCYRRNGDCRLPQATITSSSVDMEDLHMLLFTNGEVDIDKLLCLYLLTAHMTETLTPPPKSQRTSFLAREQSPLERLVDRSKKGNFDGKLLKLLPLYILEANPYSSKEPIRDPRLLSKLIINDKILQIVGSVKAALEISNPEIIINFLAVAKNEKQIRMVMSKPKMEDFFKSLHGQNIISSCESFHMEIPQRENVLLFKIDVEPLEDLVRTIRRNILQMPNTDSWKVFYRTASEELLNQTTFSKDDDSTERVIYVNPKEDVTTLVDETCLCTCSSAEGMENIDDADFLLDCSDSRDAKESARPVPPLQPKILKNLQMGFSEARYDRDAQSPKPKLEKLNFDRLANLLSQKVRKESLKDYNKMMTAKPPQAKESKEVAGAPAAPPRVILKQTTCEACMRKWKSKLPPPKTSKLKKVPLPVLKDTSYFSSRSAQRISEMIDDEVKKFDVYDRGTPAESVQLPNRAYKNLAKGSYVMGSSIEIIDLDDLELAKIRQEIKENETKKRFTKFMTTLEKY